MGNVNLTGVSTNIMVTILMFIMVFLMPFVDRKICKYLEIPLDDRASRNPKADSLLHIRKIILIFVFLLYLAAVAYVTFFSRSAADDYLVHIALYQSLANSIRIDYGILEFFNSILYEGLGSALSHIHVISREGIVQVYLNIVMFVPMGYLLPYVFDWFRRHITSRTVIASFLASFAIENLQLITRHGYYDIDDLFSNTLGGFIGQGLYMMFAYFLTHPDFRKEWKNLKRWRQRAKDRAIYPFFSRIRVMRVTLYATDKKEVFDFYGKKLGFRLKKLIADTDDTADYLSDFGKNQIEIRCSGQYKNLPVQNVTIACNNSEYLKKNLEKHGISTSDYVDDPYTGLRTFSFLAPDDTVITIIEE